MKEEQIFMMIFRYTPNYEYQPTAEQQAQMQQQWGSFIGGIALKEKLVSTHQLGFEGNQISNDLSVSHGLVLQENQTLGGNMIVKANSLEEATEMGKDCPILKMGGSVEIRSIIPMQR